MSNDVIHMLVGTTVIMLEGIDECEDYAEVGMIARIIDVSFEYQTGVVTFDFSEFEEVNKPFEGANYYGALPGQDASTAQYTARESGHYNPVDKYYLPDDHTEWSRFFDLVDDKEKALIALFQSDSIGDETYVEFLKRKVTESFLS